MSNPRYQFPNPTPHPVGILCPGPTLQNFSLGHFIKFGITHLYAVNYAALYLNPPGIEAFAALDEDSPAIWRGKWPQDLPRIYFDDGPAKQLKKRGCRFTFPLLLAEVLHRFPDSQVHLYGVDYSGHAYHTHAPYPPRRDQSELPHLAAAWHPHRHRITNHGQLRLPFLTEWLEPATT